MDTGVILYYLEDIIIREESHLIRHKDVIELLKILKKRITEDC